MKFVVEFDIEGQFKHGYNLAAALRVLLNSMQPMLEKPQFVDLRDLLSDRKYMVIAEGREKEGPGVEMRVVVVKDEFDKTNLTAKQTGTRIVKEDHEIATKKYTF